MTSNGFVYQLRTDSPGQTDAKYTAGYPTYLGADSDSARDDAYAVTTNAAGLIVITGRTQSAAFPVTAGRSVFNRAPHLSADTHDESYVVSLDTSLSGTASLTYGTFMGGGGSTGDSTGGSFCTGIVVDENGNTFVGGEVSDDGILYRPTSAPQEAPVLFPCTIDAFITKFGGF